MYLKISQIFQYIVTYAMAETFLTDGGSRVFILQIILDGSE